MEKLKDIISTEEQRSYEEDGREGLPPPRISEVVFLICIGTAIAAVIRFFQWLVSLI